MIEMIIGMGMKIQNFIQGPLQKGKYIMDYVRGILQMNAIHRRLLVINLDNPELLEEGAAMTENEAKVFIQNAMEQSRNALAELILIMPKVFAVMEKNLGEYYSNLENCKKEIQACEVAI